MTSLGKQQRLRRLLGRDGRGLVVPLDHGVSDGPLRGIGRPADAAAAVVAGGADSLVLHKGLARHVVPALDGRAWWLHLSAGTTRNPDPNDKRLVAGAEDAVRLGADGLSVHVNVGAAEESRMIADLGRVTSEAERLGLPVLAMMYPRGHEISDPHDLALVKHVARVGDELGADVVKVPYTGSVETFREVTASVGVPVLISGGPKTADDADFLRMVADSLEAGGAGVSTGRNLWQHDDPAAMTRAVRRLVHDRVALDAALAELRKGRP